MADHTDFTQPPQPNASLHEVALTDMHRRAAETDGDPKLQYLLGQFYDEGQQGVLQDHEQAFMWFLRAAEQEHKEAQYAVGCCLVNGEGVEMNEDEAMIWFRKAAMNDHVSAAYNLGAILDIRGSDAHEGEEARNEAVKYYKMAAEKGHHMAQMMLAEMLTLGSDDQGDALQWYKRAAEEHNDADAQYELGLHLQSQLHYHDEDKGSGSGSESTSYTCVNWYNKAAAQGHPDAQYRLGQCYYEGMGVEKDEGESVKWTQLAASQGQVEAMGSLGYAYLRGSGVEQDSELAVDWLKRAAVGGDAAAMYNLGLVLRENGSAEEGENWVKKARDTGYSADSED